MCKGCLEDSANDINRVGEPLCTLYMVQREGEDREDVLQHHQGVVMLQVSSHLDKQATLFTEQGETSPSQSLRTKPDMLLHPESLQHATCLPGYSNFCTDIILF